MSAVQSTAPSQSLPALNDSESFASHTAATKVGPVPALPAAATPSTHELEDLLYDLLAAGDLSVNGVKLEQVQAFLHEHARQRKTQEQFVAFFEAHGLSMRPERPNLFALPLVDSSARGAARAPVLLPDAAPSVAPSEPILVEARSRVGFVWAALGCAAIAGALALGASAVVVMRAELDRMNAALAHTANELDQLRAETAQLRAVVQSNSAALQRTARDTRLLLQAYASPIAQNSR